MNYCKTMGQLERLFSEVLPKGKVNRKVSFVERFTILGESFIEILLEDLEEKLALLCKFSGAQIFKLC